MKWLVVKGFALFVVLTILSGLMVTMFNVEFGTANFFDHHGIFFLIFIALVPRLTLLFSSVPFGGLLWWAGFFFCPRFLVASLATVNYFKSNPVLVILAWLIAIGGETWEKYTIGKRRVVVNLKGFDTGVNWPRESDTQTVNKKVHDPNVIEADYVVKDD